MAASLLPPGCDPANPGMSATEAGFLTNLRQRALDIEDVLRHVHAIFGAIDAGSLLAALPAGSEDAHRHNTALWLLDCAQHRLDQIDAAGVGELPDISSLIDRLGTMHPPSCQAPRKTPAEKWQRREHRYRRLAALDDAETSFGRYAIADAEYQRAQQNAASRLGSKADAAPEVLQARQRLDAAEDRWQRLYASRARRAAVLLALTPAPTMEAASFKIDVIKLHELNNDSAIPGEAIDLIEADMRRLAEGA